MRTALAILVIWCAVSVMVAAMYALMRVRWARDRHRPLEYWEKQPP